MVWVKQKKKKKKKKKTMNKFQEIVHLVSGPVLLISREVN